MGMTRDKLEAEFRAWYGVLMPKKLEYNQQDMFAAFMAGASFTMGTIKKGAQIKEEQKLEDYFEKGFEG